MYVSLVQITYAFVSIGFDYEALLLRCCEAKLSMIRAITKEINNLMVDLAFDISILDRNTYHDGIKRIMYGSYT